MWCGPLSFSVIAVRPTMSSRLVLPRPRPRIRHQPVELGEQLRRDLGAADGAPGLHPMRLEVHDLLGEAGLEPARGRLEEPSAILRVPGDLHRPTDLSWVAPDLRAERVETQHLITAGADPDRGIRLLHRLRIRDRVA